MPEDLARALGIFRLAPNASAGDPHRTEAEAIDGKVPANGKSAACRGSRMK